MYLELEIRAFAEEDMDENRVLFRSPAPLLLSDGWGELPLNGFFIAIHCEAASPATPVVRYRNPCYDVGTKLENFSITSGGLVERRSSGVEVSGRDEPVEESVIPLPYDF